MDSVLIVAAHPDDEVLGCGGTIARHADMGDQVQVLIVAEGATSRQERRNRNQDLEPAYHDAAQFYWGRAQAWLFAGNLFESSMPLILPRWRVQDIDTEDDWIRAELLYEASSRIR